MSGSRAKMFGGVRAPSCQSLTILIRRVLFSSDAITWYIREPSLQILRAVSRQRPRHLTSSGTSTMLLFLWVLTVLTAAGACRDPKSRPKLKAA